MKVIASYARVYASNIDEAISLFTRSPEDTPRLRFSHSSGLELALVGQVLILAGPSDVLAAFRATQVTVIVESLDDAVSFATDRRGSLVREPAEQPTGRNATVAYPGGEVVEYVEWSAATRAAVGL